MRRSLSVLLLLALLGYPAIVLGSHAAFAQSGYASMLLVAQSPWIDGAGGLALDLRVSGDTTGALIDLQLHKAVDRRGFAAFTDGTLSPTLGPAVRLPLADHLNAAGVVSIDLPAGPGTAMATAPGGIYPLVVSLVSTDGTVLDSLHTPLIHLRTGQFTPLRVSFNLEITGPPPVQPDGTLRLDDRTVRDLRALADAVTDHPTVPVDVRLPPATVTGLARSDEIAHARLLTDLTRAVGGPLRLLSAPFVTSDAESWRQADRADIHSDLLDHGDLELTDLLGSAPDRLTSILDPTAGPATLDLLNRLGSQTFVVSADHLIPRPSATDGSTTGPVRLLGEDGTSFPALIADPELTGHLTDSQGSVSAVQHLLADLALLAWMGPTDGRAAVFTMPEGATLDSLLLDLLLGVLDTAGFIRPVSLTELSDQVPRAGADAYELWPDAATAMARRAADRSLAESTVAAYSALLGGPHPAAAELGDLLEITAAAELDADAMTPYLTAVYTAVSELFGAFPTPEGQNVRLTSRRADVPFTIHNELGMPAHVLLVLQSDGRLDFPEGSVLPVTLQPGTNRISIPVEARTSGDARLQITVRSPDANQLLQLQSTQLVVRTTSLSGVGVLLFVGALLVLAIWWFRASRLRSDQPGETP